jgi:hypothetical protein
MSLTAAPMVRTPKCALCPNVSRGSKSLTRPMSLTRDHVDVTWLTSRGGTTSILMTADATDRLLVGDSLAVRPYLGRTSLGSVVATAIKAFKKQSTGGRLFLTCVSCVCKVCCEVLNKGQEDGSRSHGGQYCDFAVVHVHRVCAASSAAQSMSLASSRSA